MDDSDQDFVDLCSKLLKRVRRKAGVTEKRSVAEPSSQDTVKDIPTKRVTSRRKKKDVGPSSKGALGNNSEHVSSISTTCDEPNRLPSNTDKSKQAVVNGGMELGVGENGSSVAVDVAGSQLEDRGMGVKEKVLHRMQQFKRVNPQKLVHGERNQPAATGSGSDSAAPHPLPDNEVPSTSASSPLPLDPQVDDSDEALALRLQEELDREAQAVAQGSVVDLEQGGLFFCQLCQKDLSAMSPTGRTQHINRCLDESEDSAAPAPPPAPSVPECPICGKRFKSQMSRAAHLKRCSSTMGVAPAELLQAVQRQVAEGLTDSTANQPPQAGGSKRKGSTDPSLPGRKKPRKKPRGLDEDTMMAMALSHSLLEQENEMEREMQRELQRERGGQQLPVILPHISLSPLKWKAEPSKTSKGRGKRKKGAPPRPPPLLLVQDSETALRRLQERVAGLLLRTRAPSPPTPTRCPSSLPSCRTGAGPLWQKSALRDGGPKVISEFYTPELREFLQPWVSVKMDMVFPTKAMPGSSTNLSSTESISMTKQSVPSSQQPVSSTQAAPSSLPSTPGTGHLPVGSQTLCDLMELADEGMTLTQWGYSTPGAARDKENTATDFHLSGFVPESTDEPPDLCLSGFIPESSRNTESHQMRSLPQSRNTNRSSQKSVALSRLASDLTSMVNNPQFSDVQLQVDSGEVYFTHSFMLYARCPLLVQMVHDSGFWVQEDGMPSAQRVLLGEVPGQAVYTLLQYLYTAHCPLTHTLLPHVQELAARFNLEELQQLCQLYPAQTDLHRGVEGQGDQWGDYPAQEHQSGGEEEHQDQVFMELLRSMWNEEEVEEDEDRGEEGGIAMEEEGRGDGVTIEDAETNEERVNEEEMEEIYEFAATQRKRDEGKESEKEESEEEEEGGVTFFTETEEEQEAPIQAQSLAEHSDTGELTCMMSPQTKPPSLEADMAIGDIDTDQGNPNRIKADLNKSEGRDLERSRTATVESDRTKQFESNVTSSRSVGEVSTTKSLHSSPIDYQELNASLDRSYSRLFSDSWGVYETQEEPHTSPPTQPSCHSQPHRAIQKPSCSQPPRTMVVEGARQPELTSPPPPSSCSQPTRVRVDGSTRQTAIPTLQYSAIEIIDLSISPPLVPGVSALPVPGLSPGEVTDTGARVRTKGVVGRGKVPVCKEILQEKVPSSPEDLKRESYGPYSISVPVSPPHSTKEEPELIVLSDSSEEMEVGDLGPTSPSPPPPTRLSQNHQGYTRITTQSNTEPKKPTSITQSDTEPKKSSSKEKETIGGFVRDPSVSPSDQGLDPDPPGSNPGSAGSTRLMDCSAEMSWLIPATPPLPSRRTSSTQTFSSMRRTQLFPKANSSSSSSAASVFSSPTLPFRPSRQTSHPPRVSTHSAQTESSISRQKSDSRGLRHSSLGLDHDDLSSQKYNSGFGSTVPSKSQPKRSCLPRLTPSLSVIPPPDPSTKGTPLHNVPQPYSSTPLYSDLPKPSAPSLASPLLRDGEGDNGTRQRGRGLGISGSPWKRGGEGSLGLSLSDPHKDPLTQPRENSGSPGQRRPSSESKYFHSPGDSETGGEKERGVREESDEIMKMEELERSIVKEEEQEEEMGEDMERSSNSFQQSFLGMDEPPMAFDDSWGLNAGGGDTDGERSQAVCFSLRLQSSGGGASPPRQGRRDGEITGTSSTFTPSPLPKAYSTPSPPPPNTTTPQANPEINASLLDAEIWDDWGQEEDEALPLSQRVNPVALAQRVAQLKTPVAPRRKGQQGPLVPITPMPSYSDMDTPDLKNKLNRFGVRPLPKRQMILKLKEIHQYTHQVVSSESEDEAPSLGRPRAVGPPPPTTMEPTRKPVSCAQAEGFKEPGGKAAPTVSLVKLPGEEEDMEPLSASQGSNTSSTAPSEDSERSNPEQCLSDDSDNDNITASQSASKLQDKLVTVRHFIQSDPDLYGQILHYQPLVLSDLQARLKAAGIQLGAAKLLDYLDSQCITFTTAKPGLRGGRKRRGKGATRAGGRGRRGRGAAKTAD
ncbi:structure-specific endonuclease subunit SLX4 isoform X1 [Oncorhynchus kisutch]|uniref:structure-specific endonuclease subunit SLX4 isoform X1 n=1 Tax=Oncorhynchus kisutch TaxID=8019 RepID=UPI0012DCF2F8|nr:structure-specific endonuclease subunit SLX4 isoform X1 [Oncorhynchus kisutch]XP_031689059.1 structure-specific endonuclease subunit SLX4 isoform X1 [Oncorhynchus kisutch]